MSRTPSEKGRRKRPTNLEHSNFGSSDRLAGALTTVLPNNNFPAAQGLKMTNPTETIVRARSSDSCDVSFLRVI